MNFIKKMFDNDFDETVHSQFVRFGIGDYYPRAVMKIKSGASTKLVSGFEYGNDFIKFITRNFKGEVIVKGQIYSKEDFTSELVESKTKKKGFYIGAIDRKMSIKDLDALYEQFCTGYLLLNISGPDFNLKISQTPHNPRGKYKENFCNFSLKGELAKKAIEEYAFGIDNNFKEAFIRHRFLIDDIDIPKEFQNDDAMARLMAKRVGRLVRELTFDGKESKKEIKFKA